VTCDVEVCYIRDSLHEESSFKKKSENILMVLFSDEIQCVKYSVFIVVLLPVGNSSTIDYSTYSWHCSAVGNASELVFK